jgi:hypothetical protein
MKTHSIRLGFGGSSANYHASPVLIVALSSIIHSCGSASFQGSPSKPVPRTEPSPSEPAKEENLETASLAAVDWQWSCQGEDAQTGTDTAGHKRLYGKGNHRVSKANVKSKIPINISGKVCQPQSLPRDVVFVIDRSTSMGFSGNDPKVTGTCGRRQAVESVISAIVGSGSDARFGLVMFNGAEAPNLASTALFQSKESLYASLNVNDQTASNILCANDGGTNYTEALKSAEKMFQTSRIDTVKEIYFVSDGTPDDTVADRDGMSLAPRLKSPGIVIQGNYHPVTIATAMIGTANDEKLKALASVDQSGTPIHAGSVNANDLAKTLNKFSSNSLQSASVKYRNIGDKDWKTVSISEHLEGENFKAPAIEIDPNESPNGVEFQIEYRDARGKVYATAGSEVTWDDGLEKSK